MEFSQTKEIQVSPYLRFCILTEQAMDTLIWSQSLPVPTILIFWLWGKNKQEEQYICTSEDKKQYSNYNLFLK